VKDKRHRVPVALLRSTVARREKSPADGGIRLGPYRSNSSGHYLQCLIGGTSRNFNDLNGISVFLMEQIFAPIYLQANIRHFPPQLLSEKKIVIHHNQFR
jgi:hypothetical protein